MSNIIDDYDRYGYLYRNAKADYHCAKCKKSIFHSYELLWSHSLQKHLCFDCYEKYSNKTIETLFDIIKYLQNALEALESLPRIEDFHDYNVTCISVYKEIYNTIDTIKALKDDVNQYYEQSITTTNNKTSKKD